MKKIFARVTIFALLGTAVQAALPDARAAEDTNNPSRLLNATTALTEARTTQVQALHDYAVASARLERAIGQPIGRDTNAVIRPSPAR